MEVGEMTLADARRIIGAAEKKAEEIGQPMNIAVVEVGGNLVQVERADAATEEKTESLVGLGWS
jgi:uncharacterized protein GlcG (DUF336 family)